MPKFTLRGVEVDFPHDAYDCQVRRGYGMLRSSAQRAQEKRGVCSKDTLAA